MMQWVMALAMVLAMCAGEARAAGALRVEQLRCESLRQPLSVETTSPRLSWIVTSGQRDQVQSAYRILVASTAEQLAREYGDLWDTGKVQSDATTQIVYAGKPLASRQVCHWKVMTWDRDGVASEWSEVARWEMGLLQPDDWHAKWIDASPRPIEIDIVSATYRTVDGSVRKDVTVEVAAMAKRHDPIVASNEALGGDPAVNVRKQLDIDYRVGSALLHASVAENATAMLADSALPYLRRQFTLSKPVRSARLYSTALGVYEIHLNGSRVGRDSLAPGWTDYRKRVRYQVCDVTDQLIVGDNTIGALIGPGWFAGRAGLFHARAFYGESPALRAQLEVTYEDGSVQRIVTDESWQRHDGPILAADIMDGKIFDANRSVPDWCAAGSASEGWSAVTERNEQRNLVAEVDLPVRALFELPAISVTEPKTGRFTFDLGQNIVGVIRLNVRAKAGAVLTIRHGEMLNPDGTIYTENLRGAAATDTYICSGNGNETWQPRFTFHGFRYVEVAGLDEMPTNDAVTGIVLGSDLPSAGTFACSDDRINQLQSNIVWGLRGNYLSIPTDCPQRDERMGWMADTQVFVPTAAYNADIEPFMTKWMIDVDDAQREDGAHSDVAPVMNGLNYGTPAWADAGTIVPWAIYQRYGDTRILQTHIDSMKRWVDWCEQHSTGLIRDHDRGNDYGDWLSIGADTPKDLIGTAYFAHSTDIVAKALAVLGRNDEAEHYAELFEHIRSAFSARYVDESGHVHGETQCGYVLALRFGLLSSELQEKAIKLLVEDIRSHGWRLSTGFVGVSHLLHVLNDNGRADAAYRLLMQDAFPSWLFSVDQGATTIWERWDGYTPSRGPHPDITMNSFNHYALGSCGAWLFEGVAGIRLDPAHPGYKHFIVSPAIAGPLTWAKATYESVHGTIATHWERDGRRYTLRVTVPANTTATLRLPAAMSSLVYESGDPVKLLRHERNVAEIDVGSGEYTFGALLPNVAPGNPVFPGWYADPEVTQFGDTYWTYPTYSAPYDEQTHFDAFSSTDLMHWTKHRNVLSKQDVPWAKRAMWAPAVVEKNGKYFFFFSANDIQNDSELGGIGVAVSDSPAGPFKDYLGKPLVDAFHNGAQPIDQFVFRDPAGGEYLIYGGWGHCNIAKLRDDYTSFVPFEDGSTFKEITPEGYVEGPFMFVRDGKYYFMWSEGGWTGPDYAVAYAIGDSPMGPFQRVGRILEQDAEVATGAGHHSVLHNEKTDNYFIVYHRRPLGETDRNHRVVCIESMEFERDGKIKPVRITFHGVNLNDVR